jgi:hypothetical protein
MRIGRGNRRSGIKPAPVPPFPPQIPPGLHSNPGRRDGSSTLKMETLRSSETSVNFTRQHGVTYQKCHMRIPNAATAEMVVAFQKDIFECRHNFIVQKSANRQTIRHFRLSGSESGVRSLQVQSVTYQKAKSCMLALNLRTRLHQFEFHNLTRLMLIVWQCKIEELYFLWYNAL